MTGFLKRTRHAGIYETDRGYVVRYRDHTGRQRQHACSTLDDAKRFRAKVTLNPASGSPRSGPTVSEYAAEWLSMLAGVRPATAAEYRRDLEKYILPRIGHVRMGALDARKIRRLAYDLREEKTTRARPGTRCHAHATDAVVCDLDEKGSTVAANADLNLLGARAHRPAPPLASHANGRGGSTGSVL
jgi:hypothetical protein